MKKIKKPFLQTTLKIAWIVWISFFIVFIFLATYTHRTAAVYSEQNTFPWPGMLPDNKLYKLKVVRNKVIEKIIINPAKKTEFDLLMADKTIYASLLLMEKGNVSLAKETALKGENYYSMLVQHYNRTLLEKKKIPKELDRRISLAAKKHQEIFKKLEKAAKGEDKKTFQAAYNFSKINYDFIQGLRKPKNN